MARPNRILVDESVGGYHIISRTVGQERLLKEHDKDKFLEILFRFSKAYFVKIHSFCVMCNHFHLLVTMNTEYVPFISEKNLAERFWLATKGQYLKAEIETKIDWLNSFERDDVLERLSSISRFIGDVKQTFSRYYNREHKRSGHFWSERFKGVLVGHGFAQLYCSAYIDLNPFRANMVKKPEDYKWCTLGYRNLYENKFNELFSPVIAANQEKQPWSWYKKFVYDSAEIEDSSGLNNGNVEDLPEMNLDKTKDIDITSKILNFGYGVAIGTMEFIKSVKEELGHQLDTVNHLGLDEIFTSRIIHNVPAP